MLSFRLARPAAALLRTAVKPAPMAGPRFSAFRTITATRFTEDHEWVTLDSETKIGTVGVTDYAQKALGDVVFVELPAEGAEMEKGESIGTVESVKAASDIYAPVSGTVTAINEKLTDQPGLINKAPQGDGWLVKIELTDAASFDGLMDDAQYKAHCEGQ